MADTSSRNLGSIYTPSDFAQLLTDWAVQDKRQKVLDIGVGEGAFTFAAYHRLVRLGARPSIAQRQIYGAEIHSPAYKRFIELASQSRLSFPKIYRADYFETEFPPVDAVIGNPPYVRRACIDDIENIRQSVLQYTDSPHVRGLSRMADLYVYFLLQAACQLKGGGRLAVITADSWMNTQYGVALKEFLKDNFRIESLVSFDRQIFAVEVKPIMLFATKKKALQTRAKVVRFIRAKNGLKAEDVLRSLNHPRTTTPDLIISRVKPSELKAEIPWGSYLKAPRICDELATHDSMTSLSRLGKTSIGIQTLAKKFFILSPERARALQIEPEYLEPVALSSRYYNSPCIEPGSTPLHFLFYCAKSKAELVGTQAHRYIEQGEKDIVLIRGKDKTVVGYHNKDRIKRACRPHWYDLRSAQERRGRAEILIPRLAYRKFQIVWNRAKFVPGELFIGFTPCNERQIEYEVYLAILTSSLTELLLRVNAQLYGGGAYNISPGQIGDLPVLDATRLTKAQRETLKQIYLRYLSDTRHDRELLDQALFDILGLDHAARHELKNTLQDLIALCSSPKPSVESEG